MDKLKLDLHVHPGEMTSYTPITREFIEEVIQQVKSRGLDGMAVTEHQDAEYGFEFCIKVREYFSGCKLLFIPGKETFRYNQDVVELYLSEELAFRFIAHPKRLVEISDTIGGIEVANALHGVDKEYVEGFLERNNYDLLRLNNSDAHALEEIGGYYSVVSLSDLRRKAGPCGDISLKRYLSGYKSFVSES